MARSRCSVLKQLTSRWSTSLCISERFICILTPKIHETTTTIFLWNKAYFHLTLQVSLKFLLRWGDYKNCRNYTFQLYIRGSANTLLAYNKWPLLKTLLPPRYGSRCWDPAEIPHIPYLTLRGGVLLLPRHPDQQILLALSRIPPHEEKVLSQRKVLRINSFETKCKITYVFFITWSFATVQQQLEVMREICLYTYTIWEMMELFHASEENYFSAFESTRFHWL